MSQECPMHCFDFAVVSLCEGPCYRRNVKISLNYRSPLHNILNSFGIYLFHTINFLISYHNYFAVLSVDHLVWISIASRNTFCSGAWTLSIPFTVTAYRRFNGRSRTKASPSPSSFSSTVVGGSNYSSQISFNQVFIIHKINRNYLRGFKYLFRRNKKRHKEMNLTPLYGELQTLSAAFGKNWRHTDNGQQQCKCCHGNKTATRPKTAI